MIEKNVKMTPSLEDYLEKILFLNQRNGNVRVTDVAVEMNISKPSVNKAVNILKEQGYVSHEHYGLLELTESGRKVAESVAKRHIIIKKFLFEVLKIEEDKAEEEACMIEHVVSADTIDKLTEHVEFCLKGNF